ncbi:MAG: hypothetical protein JXL97_07745 [Bacteroidales bacterium]|nr:hypothetical protein [Bacteroidales bacterium]
MNNGFFNFFNQIFIKKQGDGPYIQFGKYSDRNKTVEQLQYWKNSFILFNEKKYFIALENFFKYVKDPEIENLSYELKDEKIHFKFFQGSKQVFGVADSKKIYAYSEIVKFDNLTDDFLKFVLESNHNLKFSKFSIDSKSNVLKLELNLITNFSNPITLYSALREIGIKADEYDDKLIFKFPGLESINIGHIKPLSDYDIKIKIQYLRNWVEESLKIIEKYDSVKFVGARSFIILALIYRIYFLLSPEGELLQEINRMHDIFYADNNKTDFERNVLIIRKLELLLTWSDERIQNSLYFVYSTFPVAPPVEPEVIIKFAQSEINKIHWYFDNEHKDIAIAIAEYIIGYASYNFGALPIISDIFAVFWEILHHKFFIDLKFSNIPYEKNNINYLLLNQIFNKINTLGQKNYPNLNFNIKHLNLANNNEFLMSYIYEFVNCDFSTEIEEQK